MDHRQLVYFVQHNRNYVAQRTVFLFSCTMYRTLHKCKRIRKELDKNDKRKEQK